MKKNILMLLLLLNIILYSKETRYDEKDNSYDIVFNLNDRNELIHYISKYKKENEYNMIKLMAESLRYFGEGSGDEPLYRLYSVYDSGRVKIIQGSDVEKEFYVFKDEPIIKRLKKFYKEIDSKKEKLKNGYEVDDESSNYLKEEYSNYSSEIYALIRATYLNSILMSEEEKKEAGELLQKISDVDDYILGIND